MYTKRITVDLAKNIFQLAVFDVAGKVVDRKRLNRIASQMAFLRIYSCFLTVLLATFSLPLHAQGNSSSVNERTQLEFCAG